MVSILDVLSHGIRITFVQTKSEPLNQRQMSTGLCRARRIITTPCAQYDKSSILFTSNRSHPDKHSSTRYDPSLHLHAIPHTAYDYCHGASRTFHPSIGPHVSPCMECQGPKYNKLPLRRARQKEADHLRRVRAGRGTEERRYDLL